MTKSGSDLIGKIISIVFGAYIVAYALMNALLAQVNSTVNYNLTQSAGGAATAPLLNILIPIIVAIGIGWMFYKHMAVK